MYSLHTLQLPRFRLESQYFEPNHKISSLRVLISSQNLNGTGRFTRLSLIAMLILVIPHSNAEEEHVFSMVCKNKTAFRANLYPKGTLSSIFTIKLANSQPAHCYEPTNTVFKKAKSATYEYNRAHNTLDCYHYFLKIIKI